GEPAPSPLRVLEPGRPVQERERLGEAREPEADAVGLVEVLVLVRPGEELVQVALEDPAQDPLGDLLARRIAHEDRARRVGAAGPATRGVPVRAPAARGGGLAPAARARGRLGPALPAPAPEHRVLPRLELTTVEEADRSRHEERVALAELAVEPGLPRPRRREETVLGRGEIGRAHV